eukprot:scaffold7346_cov245-Pinguiococcus_pyrenoidosus.AAC.40
MDPSRRSPIEDCVRRLVVDLEGHVLDRRHPHHASVATAQEDCSIIGLERDVDAMSTQHPSAVVHVHLDGRSGRHQRELRANDQLRIESQIPPNCLQRIVEVGHPGEVPDVPPAPITEAKDDRVHVLLKLLHEGVSADEDGVVLLRVGSLPPLTGCEVVHEPSECGGRLDRTTVAINVVERLCAQKRPPLVVEVDGIRRRLPGCESACNKLVVARQRPGVDHDPAEGVKVDSCTGWEQR